MNAEPACPAILAYRGRVGRFAFCGTFSDPGREALLGSEADAIAMAVPKRVREFAAGRWCAREAMGLLGQVPCAIPMGRSREPLWPPGTSGAISHSGNFACALVTDSGAAVGLDVEGLEGPGRDGIWGLVMDGEESAACPDEAGRLLVFSAKESLYKALHGKAGRYFDFRAARFRSRWDGTFELALEEDLAEGLPRDAVFSGAYRTWKGLLFTAILVPETGRGYRPGWSYGSPEAAARLLGLVDAVPGY